MRKPPNIRRVVTGHDRNGKSTVWMDSFAANTTYPDDKLATTMMWSTDRSPTELFQDVDEGNRALGVAPPPGGSRFTILEIEPGNTFHGLHKTDTVDYVICISGEIDMVLDEQNVVHLNAGDVVIQRGTDHAWVNRGSQPCRLAVVLLDAVPKRPGSVAGTQFAR